MDYSGLNEIYNSSNSNGDVATVLAVFGFFLVFILVVCLLAIIFNIFSRWIFFKKCGEDGWKSLIPFYNEYVLIKIAGLNWWWIFLIFAGTILSIIQSSFSALDSLDTAADFEAAIAILSIFGVLASFATIFAKINEGYNISKKFNKSGGYAVLIILFEPIMFLVLGLSKNEKYDANVEVSPNGLIGATSSKQIVYCPDCGTAVQEDFCPKCGKKVR